MDEAPYQPPTDSDGIHRHDVAKGRLRVLVYVLLALIWVIDVVLAFLFARLVWQMLE
jgi:hypothetical protein